MNFSFLLAAFLLSSGSLNLAHAQMVSEVRQQETVEELIKSSLAARAKGDFHGALEILFRAQELEPNNLDVRFYIGLTFYNLGDLPRSETTLRSVLALAPHYVDAKIILGRVLIALGQLKEAELLLRQAINQTPDYLDAYDALSSALLAQKRTDEAIRVIDQALARAPGNGPLLLKRGTLLFFDKRYNEALQVSDLLIASSEVDLRYDGYLLRGKIEFDQNMANQKSAEHSLRSAIALNPNRPEAYLVLADVQASLWKFSLAIAVLNEGLRSVEDDTQLQVKLEQVKSIEKQTQVYSLSLAASEWRLEGREGKWREFYLDAAWRIDPYKTLIFGVESFSRDSLSDQTLRLEYVQRLNKWIYAYVAGRITHRPDFRESSAIKLGTSFVTNPLSIGSTVVTFEGELRNYDNKKIYFIVAGGEQYIGKAFILNAKLYQVISDQGEDFRVWSAKITWNMGDKGNIYAGYGTMTEDVSGNLRRGHSWQVGGQYQVTDHYAITGNYTRHSNEIYKANQVTVGFKVGFGRRPKP